MIHLLTDIVINYIFEVDLIGQPLFYLGVIMSIGLYDYQIKAVNNMHNGCILCGGVGSGKSRTSLAYYYKLQGGDLNADIPEMKNPKNLIIITTAKKRDSKEWEGDMAPFLLSTNPEVNHYKNVIFVDSWNNIKKYVGYEKCFFIFDEQRVVGYGTWTKSFIRITKKNDWVLLSATPGDNWSDYMPVFIANGFYKNKTDFNNQHVEFDPYCKFPKIKSFHNTGRLIRLRNNILVDMDFDRPTTAYHIDVFCDYNKMQYKDVCKNRWNYQKDKPIENGSELCYEMRRVVNSDHSRLNKIVDIFKDKKRVIIFYNFDYELEMLISLFESMDVTYAQLNGHAHQPVPDTEEWAYFVQYTAGAEAWNCIKTNTIIFFSQNYSYKVLEQSSGRIDRLNTPYQDLFYYHLKSRSGIDVAISKALSQKKKFNESRFVSFQPS